MMQPLPLDTVLSEFSEQSEAWVLQSKRKGTYLTIPDNRFPGRRPVRFFMSREDADRMLAEVLKVNPSLTGERITPVSVKLLQALRSIAADKTPGHADSFVIHSPNE
ncbi:MAG: hypothetical protein ACRETT_02955, partial [Steroidobacteraceae bacterium]